MNNKRTRLSLGIMSLYTLIIAFNVDDFWKIAFLVLSSILMVAFMMMEKEEVE